MGEGTACTLDYYICDKYSVCREERQYAYYLANVLRYYGKKANRSKLEDNTFFNKVLQCCFLSSDAEIIDVYYEAAFMRDFFERNRRSCLSGDDDSVFLKNKYSPKNYIIKKEDSFNHKLIKYIIDNIIGDSITRYIHSDIQERNFGARGNDLLEYTDFNNIPEQADERKNLQLLKKWMGIMMNAIPDLAVIYEKDKKKRLLFIECKFESGEDKYKVDEGGKTIPQTEVQKHVACFLKNAGFIHIELDEMMDTKKKDKNIVYFCREETADKIDISNLTDLEKKIFGASH